MTKATLNTKLLKCFFAFALVLGLCVPSIGSAAYGEPDQGVTFTEVNDVMQEGGEEVGDNGEGTVVNGVDGADEGAEGGDADVPAGEEGPDGAEADAGNENNSDEAGEGDAVAPQQPADDGAQEKDGIAPLSDDEGIEALDAAGAFTVTGGTAGTDYSYASGVLTILTSTPLTISNGAQTTDRIQIASGVHADITLDGVFIVTGTGAPLGLAGSSGTRAHVTLADGSVNKLVATGAFPAVQCEGTCEIVIDDEVRNSTELHGNVDDRSSEVVPSDGRIKDTVTLGNGTVLQAGSSVDGLSSANPGTLYARGGPYSAGIGSRQSQIAGYLIFNGGIIRAGAYGGVSTAASIAGLDNAFADGLKQASTGGDSSGAGIGGGDYKGATQMVFNNAEIYAYGSYHGAAIGSGWHSATAGDIFINGGYICAQGYEHGNAFGRGCGGNNNGHIIKVSGGTLLPYVTGSNSHLGGTGGNVIITGGSVHATKFEPSAYNTDTDVFIPSPNANDQVFMLTIDLKASDGLGDDANNGPVKIDNFSLTITGSEKTYGAPSFLDDGKLYIWLPKSVTQGDKEVRVDLTVSKYNAETGAYESTPVDTLFIQKPTESGGNMKRFLFFDFPEAFQGALHKKYDGLPFEPWVLSDSNYIEYVNPTDGTTQILNKSGYSETLKKELVQFSYQAVDENNKPIGALSPEGAAALPADAGSFQITMTSYQYAEDSKFASSYYGHRSTGTAVIETVPSRIVSLKAAWGKTDGNKSDAFDKLIVVGDVTSGKGTATTCKAPTGEIEIVVDGEVVDTVPVTYPADGVEGNTTVVTSKSAADGLIAAAIANNKLNNSALFNMARSLPLQEEAGIAVAADAPTSSAERDASYDGREHGIFTYTIDVSKNDYLMPATPNGDKHTVTLNYRPDKNYLDSLGLEDNNLQEEIEVEQVKPDSGVTPGPGSDVKEDPVDPDDPDNPDTPTDPTDPSSKEFKKSYTVTGTYGTNDGKIEMTIQSPSYGPFEITNSNGAVIAVVQPELVTDADGNPVKNGDNLQYKVVFDMASAGETDIVMTQKASGAYGKSTFIFDVTVYPNPGDAPKVDVSVEQENLGNPDTPDADVAPEGMAQPGDVIRYTVTASNTVPGSAWQTPEITDVLSDDVTIDPDSIEVAINYPTPPDTPEVDEDGNPIPVPEPVWVKPDPSTYDIVDGKVVFKPEASIYGGQSVSIRFNAKVNAGTSDRDKDQDPVEISNEATGAGSYGVNENPATQATNPGTKTDIPDANITVTNPDPLTVIPDDVADGQLSVAKTVKNLSRSNGDRALVGDELEFTIKVTNNTPDSCLYNAFVLDPLPKGVTYVAGSLKLVNAEGEASTPSDSAYNASLNALGLYVGDLYYGEEVTVTFTAKVGSDAREGGADNVAFSSGDQPTKEKDPDKDKPSDDPDNPDNPDDPSNPSNPDDPSNPDKPHYPNNPVDPSDPGKKPQLPTDPDDINKNTPEDPDYDPTKPSVNVDIDGDGIPDVNIDTDGDGIPDVNIVDKDGDGQPDNIDPKDPSIDPDDKDTWPKPDVNVLPKDPSDPGFDPTTDLIPEVNVDTDGDGVPDVNIDTDGDGVPDTKIDTDKDGVPDDEETPVPPTDPDSFWADKPGMTPDDLDEFIEQLPVTGTNEDDPASPGVVLPSDPNMSNITITKAAENLTHDDGFTYVGDQVRYTITVANSQVDSAWMAVVVRDDVPVGIEPITDSFKVILADGTEVPVPADSYDPATRILAVNMGDVEGGTEVKFVFDAEIGEEALDADVGNIAKAYGSLPSGIPGDELNNRAQPGSKFTPSQGWPAYEATHAGISNPDKVYPSAKISAQNKVRPNPDAAANELGKKLAKTGDDGTLFMGTGILALAALAMAVFSWRRRRNSF